MPGNDEQGRVTIRTILLCGSERLDCGTIATTALVRGGNEAQATGSALTYLRRYALSAIAGVAQEDDDGNSAGPSGQQSRQQPRPAVSQGYTLLTGKGKDAYTVNEVGSMLSEMFGAVGADGPPKAAVAFVQGAVSLDIGKMMDMADARAMVANALRDEWSKR
jgi:hypothetical protein